MKCPNCSAELKYTERPKRRCSKCSRPFALEPRESPLGLSDLRLRGLAERVSAAGKRRYTPAQLTHYLSRRNLSALKPPGVGCMVMIAFFAFLGFMVAGSALHVLVGILAAALVIGVGTYWFRTGQESAARPKLPLSVADVQSKILAPWREVYGAPPQGLVEESELQRLRGYQPPQAAIRAVLAASSPELLDCLWANELPRRLGLALLSTRLPHSPEELQLITLLRENPRIPLLLLHDASAEGCGLIHTIPAQFNLGAGHPVIDLGLRPREVIEGKLLRLGAPPAPELLAILERQSALGGPHALSTAELEWLRAGNMSPILALPPGRLIRLITQAMRQHGAGAPPAKSAEAAAREVGFMSWPV